MNNTLNTNHITVSNGVMYLMSSFAQKYLKATYTHCKVTASDNNLTITFSDKKMTGYLPVRAYPNRSSYRIPVGMVLASTMGSSYKMTSNTGRTFKFSVS